MTLIHLSFGILPDIQPLIFHEVGGRVGGGRRYEMCHFMYHIWAARTPLFTRRLSAWPLSLIHFQIQHAHPYTNTHIPESEWQMMVSFQFHLLNQSACKWMLVLVRFLLNLHKITFAWFAWSPKQIKGAVCKNWSPVKCILYRYFKVYFTRVTTSCCQL